MTVYVDPLLDHGWILRGHQVRSCHLFSDELDLQELHELARRIGCRPEWFQDKALPHYDLTLVRRQEAIGAGAVPVTRREAVEIWKRRRARVDELVRPVWIGLDLASGPDRTVIRTCSSCCSQSYCERLLRCARAA